MSASSNCVTCGRFTQLACSRGPAIFWTRVRGLSSIGPNFAKSTTGTRGSPEPAPAAAAGAWPLSARLTHAFTSACRTRFFGPVPVTRPRSTPSSRATSRTDGLACTRAKPASATGLKLALAAARGGSALRTVGGAGGGAGGFAGAAGSVADAAIGATLPWLSEGTRTVGSAVAAESGSGSTSTIEEPVETLSPFFMWTATIRPAAVEGTSIVAFSVSSVASGLSIAMTSPLLTSTSTTSTSLKSPRSGTRTAIGAAIVRPIPGWAWRRRCLTSAWPR